jgi:hypothetical protein
MEGMGKTVNGNKKAYFPAGIGNKGPPDCELRSLPRHNKVLWEAILEQMRNIFYPAFTICLMVYFNNVKEFIISHKYKDKLTAHSNELATTLFNVEAEPRRLNRFKPADLMKQHI